MKQGPMLLSPGTNQDIYIGKQEVRRLGRSSCNLTTRDRFTWLR